MRWLSSCKKWSQSVVALFVVAALVPRRFPYGTITYDEILDLVPKPVTKGRQRVRRTGNRADAKRQIRRVAERLRKSEPPIAIASPDSNRTRPGFSLRPPIPTDLLLWFEAKGRALIGEELWSEYRAEAPHQQRTSNPLCLSRIAGLHAMLKEQRFSETAYFAYHYAKEFEDANSRARLLHLCGLALMKAARSRTPHEYFRRARTVLHYLTTTQELTTQLEPALLAQAHADLLYCRVSCARARQQESLQWRFAHRQRLEGMADEINWRMECTPISDLDTQHKLTMTAATVARSLAVLGLTAADRALHEARAKELEERRFHLASALGLDTVLIQLFDKVEAQYQSASLQARTVEEVLTMLHQYVEISRSDLILKRDDRSGRALPRIGACMTDLLKRGAGADDRDLMRLVLNRVAPVRKRLLALQAEHPFGPDYANLLKWAEEWLARKKDPPRETGLETEEK